jgi:hypothetical protein
VGPVRVGRIFAAVLPPACLSGAVLALAAFAHASSGSGLWLRLDARCSVADARLEPYPWPIKPFHRQHPVRGNFGDPRTVIFGHHAGVFSFHNGVDISAWSGNQVYPVASGTVFEIVGDEIITKDSHDRRFQYIHVHPWVKVGERVTVSRTVLGTIFEPWEHVHLTELRGSCVVNPLAPGHLTPYVDRTRPEVLAISFATPTGRRLSPTDLHGEIEAVARAQDEPALPGPGVWGRMPVSPALVTWRIVAADGRRVRVGVAADFRETEPPEADFCAVYAPRTIQNFAAEGGRFNWGRAGRYVFQLGNGPLDTSSLPNGRYRLTVAASDTGGNVGRRSVTIEIANHGRSAVETAPPDWRCAARSLVTDR